MLKLPIAKIEALFIADSPDDFITSPRQELEFDLDGIIGDQRHRGRTMLADIRIKAYRKKQTEVLNRQTVSLIDDRSLDMIGDELDIDADVVLDAYGESRRVFLARCLGANILLGNFEGTFEVPVFYDLPNATDFGPFNPGCNKISAASLMITRYNFPCIHPGRKIEQRYPNAPKGLAQRFVQVAEEDRGFVGMVVAQGSMAVGDSVMFYPLPSGVR